MTEPTEKTTRRWLMAYDVGDDRRRRSVSGLLESHGLRIQRSVFVVECTQHVMAALLTRGQAMLAPDDRLAAWPVVHHAGLPTPWQQRQQQARLPEYWLA